MAEKAIVEEVASNGGGPISEESKEMFEIDDVVDDGDEDWDHKVIMMAQKV